MPILVSLKKMETFGSVSLVTASRTVPDTAVLWAKAFTCKIKLSTTKRKNE
jgi:hypothetical protein